MGPRVVKGGGLEFLTDDPFLIRAVQRCAELEAELRERRHNEVARYRALRRDVSSIKKTIKKFADRPTSGDTHGN